MGIANQTETKMRDDWRCLILCLLATLCLCGCPNNDSTDTIVGDLLVPIDDPGVVTVASANTSFGFKLLHDLRERETTPNIFISPLSISIALTMTYNGAAGQTERAMAEVLEIDGLDLSTINNSNEVLRNSLENADPNVENSIANSLWSRQGVELNPNFLERNQQFFEAKIAALDFSEPQAIKTINQWVETNTNGKIKKIVHEISPATVLFLINAIYFKGSWQNKFDTSQTRSGIFQLSDGTQKQVQMMNREGEYPYFRGEHFEAASLPYGDGRLSMYIFLPTAHSNLNDFLEGLNTKSWQRWLSQFHNETLHLMLPRFKLEYEATLNDTLKALGMEIAFDSGADFSGMGPTGLFISEVRHKTFVEVNEQGTEAAAATAVIVAESAKPVFHVNRPFFFVIHDIKTNTILFMGTVTEPM